MLKKIVLPVVFVPLILVGIRFYLVSHSINTPLPLIKLTEPSSTVPTKIAAFSGKWEGVWGGLSGRFIDKGIDTTLVVEQINSKRAKVILSYGNNESLGIIQGFHRFTIPIKETSNTTLEWDWSKWGVSLQFKLADDLNSINGRAKIFDTGEQFSVTLQKSELGKDQVFKGNPLVSSYRYQQPQKRRDGWLVDTLVNAGLNEQKISDLTKSIQLGKYKNIHALLIEYDGKLIYEQYFEGEDQTYGGGQRGHIVFDHETLHDLRSVSKSVTSALFGIAFKDDIKEVTKKPLSNFFDELSVENQTKLDQVTLKQVLTMTSGFRWNEAKVPYDSYNNDFNRMVRGDSPVNYVLSLPIEGVSGKSWVYNSGLTEILAELIQRKTGKQFKDYAKEVLFEPLGISEFRWASPVARVNGKLVTWSDNRPAASAGLRMLPRDLAKIGSVYLHEGRWGEKQIVPEEWVQLSMQRHVDHVGVWSDGIWGYGYQWWHGKFETPIEYSVIAGFGDGGQRLFIIPKEKIVVTILAGHYGYAVSDETNILHQIMLSKKDG